MSGDERKSYFGGEIVRVLILLEVFPARKIGFLSTNLISRAMYDTFPHEIDWRDARSNRAEAVPSLFTMEDRNMLII